MLPLVVPVTFTDTDVADANAVNTVPNDVTPVKVIEPQQMLLLPVMVVTDTVFAPVGSPPILPHSSMPPADALLPA
jgi:hypothetical protein